MNQEAIALLEKAKEWIMDEGGVICPHKFGMCKHDNENCPVFCVDQALALLKKPKQQYLPSELIKDDNFVCQNCHHVHEMGGYRVVKDKPECDTCGDKEVVQIECEACAKDIHHHASECGGEKPCPDCQQPKDQPSSEFTVKVRTTLAEMSHDGRLTGYILDVEEIAGIRRLCDRLDKSEASRKELLDALSHIKDVLESAIARPKEIAENWKEFLVSEFIEKFL